MKGRLCAYIMVCAAAVLGFCGCVPRDTEKMVALPEKKTEEDDGIHIKNIQEYSYNGHSEDVVYLSWGKAGTKTVCILKRGENGYEYHMIDVEKKEVLKSTFVDDRDISDVKIAPGGKYIVYEAASEKEVQLVVFFTEDGTRQVLEKWDVMNDAYTYEWSDDGTKFFAWEIGDNYAKDPYEDWYITRYDVAGAKMGDEKAPAVKKSEFLMEGTGHGWRSVLPNADGSEVYVREEHEDYVVGGVKEEGYIENEEDVNKENMNKSEKKPPGGKGAESWILAPDTGEKKKLEEFSSDAVYPVKYTKAGLFAKDLDGNLLLVENVGNEPVVNKLCKTYDEIVNICENGDHLFRLEWMDNSLTHYQVSGARIEDGQLKTRQVLYKSQDGEGADGCHIVDDSMVAILDRRYFERGDRHTFNITVLEY